MQAKQMEALDGVADAARGLINPQNGDVHAAVDRYNTAIKEADFFGLPGEAQDAAYNYAAEISSPDELDDKEK